ncbi:hypothetical protein ALO93_200299 [Pseudomonas amygdali pv. sesami]|nr:hypothetical protein ALO93_200299 [Pseudomonas amygdali pv. sesami]
MKIQPSKTAASKELLDIEAFNLGHRGTHLSCMCSGLQSKTAVLAISAIFGSD